MAVELDLKALRGKVAVIGYSADPTYEPNFVEMAIFILKQIERVEGCENCDSTGIVFDFQEVGCVVCSHLRADLLELQKRVLG